MSRASDNSLVPIRTVCAMYNLNPNTLRTWERRYGIVHPQRSEGGHRAFGERDVANIELMLRLLARGLGPAEAARQVKRDQAETNGAPKERHTELRSMFRAAIKNMKLPLAHAACKIAVDELGYQHAVEYVLFPELTYLGHRWETLNVGVAREHVGTLAVQMVLMEEHRNCMNDAKGPTVLLACAPGEQHELPVIHVANLLCKSGEFTPLSLVGGLPMSEILDSARRGAAVAIVLSATMLPRADIVRQWINELISAGWETQTILVGIGFTRSRIFSETKVRSAAGNYDQVLALLRRLNVGGVKPEGVAS